MKVELEITLDEAKALYEDASPKLKESMLERYPQMKWNGCPCILKTKWAFEKLGMDYCAFEAMYSSMKNVILATDMSEEQKEKEILNLNRSKVLRALEIVIEAKNGDWIPDWNNKNQYKWIPWFYLDSFRFDNAYYRHAYTCVGCSSRLHLRNEAEAIEVAKEYFDLWEYYMTV